MYALGSGVSKGVMGKGVSVTAYGGRIDDPAALNQELAGMLRRRCIYRPIVILDAERCKRHNLSIPEDARHQLAQVFGAQDEGARRPTPGLWRDLVEMEAQVNGSVLAHLDEHTRDSVAKLLRGAPATFATCMKPSVLFKNPRILVRVPTGLNPVAADGEGGQELHSPGPRDVRSLDEWLSQVISLYSYELDQGTFAQILALRMRYKELWRLYIFAHPGLFEDEAHRIVLDSLKVRWESKIAEVADIPRMPPNVAADDLRPVGVLATDVGDRTDLLRAALAAFGNLPILPASRVLRESSLSVRELRDRLEGHKREHAVAAAAKGGTAEETLDPEQSLAELSRLAGAPVATPEERAPSARAPDTARTPSAGPPAAPEGRGSGATPDDQGAARAGAHLEPIAPPPVLTSPEDKPRRRRTRHPARGAAPAETTKPNEDDNRAEGHDSFELRPS